MEIISVSLLLVVSAICAAHGEAVAQCSDTCSPSTISSCSNKNCSCASGGTAMYYNESNGAVTCSGTHEIVTYSVEFNPGSDTCSDYFNDTYIFDWTFKGISHDPSCNITEGCCNSTSIQGCFTSNGLNGTHMLDVNNTYPYISVIAEFNTPDFKPLTIRVSLLQLCNSDQQWLPNATACGEYMYSNPTDSDNCTECDNGYDVGCFNFTLISPESPSTPSSTPPPTSSESMATMTTGTSAAPMVNHSLGTVLLLAFLQLFCATFL